MGNKRTSARLVALLNKKRGTSGAINGKARSPNAHVLRLYVAPPLRCPRARITVQPNL
jgi:hypothetical protein